MPDLTVLFYNPPSLRPPRLGAICAAALAMLASAAGRPAIASATTGGTGPTATLRPAPTQGTLTPPPADRLITLGPIDAWKPGQNPTQRWRLAGAAPVNLHDCLWLPAGTNHSIIKYLYRPHSVGFVRKGLRNALGQIKLKAFANLAIRGRVLTWRWLGRPTPRVAQALLYSMIVLEKNKNSPTVALTFLKIPRWRPTPPGRGLPPLPKWLSYTLFPKTIPDSGSPAWLITPEAGGHRLRWTGTFSKHRAYTFTAAFSLPPHGGPMHVTSSQSRLLQISHIFLMNTIRSELQTKAIIKSNSDSAPAKERARRKLMRLKKKVALGVNELMEISTAPAATVAVAVRGSELPIAYVTVSPAKKPKKAKHH